MQLLTTELRQSLPPFGTCEDDEHALALVKFVTFDTTWTWYAAEFDGDDTFFGVVDGFEVEYGYFTLSELSNYRGVWGAPILRDPAFVPKRLTEICRELRQLRPIR